VAEAADNLETTGLSLKLVTELEAGAKLAQVQNLLQHALDHDGYLPIGEHIYLKLKTGQPTNFEQMIVSGHEAAGAFLVYRKFGLAHSEDSTIPGAGLVAYAQLLAQPHNQPTRLLAEVVVHPHLRRQGIGQKLLQQIIALGRRGNFEQLDLWAYNARATSQKFAAQLNLEPARTLHFMRREASLPLPEYTLPHEFRLRPFQPGQDDAAWLALNRLVFAHHPENGSWTQSDLDIRFTQAWLDPADFLVLENQAGRMLGFNWTKRVPSRQSDLYASPAYPAIAPAARPPLVSPLGGRLGEIYVVGLHPETRGFGLGRGLTLLGLQHLRASHAEVFTLYVDANNTPAVKLYYSLGFSLDHNDICYTLRL